MTNSQKKPHGIKELREANGITQMQAAIYCGVSTATIQRWDRNIYTANVKHIVKLAELFNVTIDELVGIVPRKERGSK